MTIEGAGDLSLHCPPAGRAGRQCSEVTIREYVLSTNLTQEGEEKSAESVQYLV